MLFCWHAPENLRFAFVQSSIRFCAIFDSLLCNLGIRQLASLFSDNRLSINFDRSHWNWIQIANANRLVVELTQADYLSSRMLSDRKSIIDYWLSVIDQLGIKFSLSMHWYRTHQNWPYRLRNMHDRKLVIDSWLSVIDHLGIELSSPNYPHNLPSNL